MQCDSNRLELNEESGRWDERERGGGGKSEPKLTAEKSVDDARLRQQRGRRCHWGREM